MYIPTKPRQIYNVDVRSLTNYEVAVLDRWCAEDNIITLDFYILAVYNGGWLL